MDRAFGPREPCSQDRVRLWPDPVSIGVDPLVLPDMWRPIRIREKGKRGVPEVFVELPQMRVRGPVC